MKSGLRWRPSAGRGRPPPRGRRLCSVVLAIPTYIFANLPTNIIPIYMPMYAYLCSVV